MQRQGNPDLTSSSFCSPLISFSQSSSSPSWPAIAVRLFRVLGVKFPGCLEGCVWKAKVETMGCTIDSSDMMWSAEEDGADVRTRLCGIESEASFVCAKSFFRRQHPHRLPSLHRQLHRHSIALDHALLQRWPVECQICGMTPR